MAKVQSASGRQWAGDQSRLEKQAALNLGIIGVNQEQSKKFRRKCLDDLDAYYENRAYDDLKDWDEANRESAEYGNYTPIRDRRPKIQVNMAKVFASRVTSKLTGQKSFPTFQIEEDPDTTQFLQLVQKLVNFRAHLAEPMRRLVVAGSVFVRFKAMVDEEDGRAAIRLEHYLSKYCYPEFDALGELDSVRVQYVYDDSEDLDEQGQPRKKWFKLELSRASDVLFDNPLYSPNSDPVFQEIERAEHNLGFVQGTWFRSAEDRHSPDGPSLIEDSLDLIDEINYNTSQSSQAISYNQEPQMTIKGLDAEQLEDLIKSSTKAWNMGRDGEAKFLESDLGAVETAKEFREGVRLAFQDVARVSLHDPEKIDGNSLSGRAMELLNSPFVDLIDELRAILEPGLIDLLTKITVTVLQLMQRGADFGLEVPQGWQPASLNIQVIWPAVFPLTLEDLQKKATLGTTVAAANVISRETVTRWLAKDFDVEDVEAEIAKIAAQPVLNPFGSF